MIDLRGEINGAADNSLDAAYREAMEDDARAVLLNFTEVEYMDSTGIALIVSILARSRDVDARVLVTGLSAHFQEIFEITRLTEFMSIFPDEESALADISGSADSSAAER